MVAARPFKLRRYKFHIAILGLFTLFYFQYWRFDGSYGLSAASVTADTPQGERFPLPSDSRISSGKGNFGIADSKESSNQDNKGSAARIQQAGDDVAGHNRPVGSPNVQETHVDTPGVMPKLPAQDLGRISHDAIVNHENNKHQAMKEASDEYLGMTGSGPEGTVVNAEETYPDFSNADKTTPATDLEILANPLKYFQVFLSGGGISRSNGAASKILPPAHRPRVEKYPVKNPTKVPEAKLTSRPKIQAISFPETEDEKKVRLDRKAFVSQVFMTSWKQYKTYAWGKDELRPVSNEGFDPFLGWAATAIDAMDTLQIMRLDDEYRETVKLIESINFNSTSRNYIPMFETNIRYLGGLLSSYDLSGGKESTLLEKAKNLGDLLMGAFDTPNRMPITYYKWRDGYQHVKYRAGHSSLTAEIGSFTVEFTRLSQLTGDPRYYDAVARITDMIYDFTPNTSLPGLLPQTLDVSGCRNITVIGTVDVPLQPYRDMSAKSTPELEKIVKDVVVPPGTSHAAPKIGGASAQKDESIIVDSGRAAPVGAEAQALALAQAQAIAQAQAMAQAEKTAGDSKAAKESGDGHFLNRRDITGIGTEGLTIDLEHEVIREKEGSLKWERLRCDREENKIKSGNIRGSEVYTLGGMTDSTLEYYMKEYLLLGGGEPKYAELYTQMVKAIKEHLLYRPMVENNDDILFTSTRTFLSNSQNISDDEMSHLVCYVGGMLALGGRVLNRPEDVEIAAKVTNGCVWAYNSTRTGIMPETFLTRRCPGRYDSHEECVFDFDAELNKARANEGQPINSAQTVLTPRMPPVAPISDSYDKTKTRWDVGGAYDMPRSYLQARPSYIMRPEAIESVFYMYRVTGDKIWQERGWQMFKSIAEATKLLDKASQEIVGYTSIVDVTDDSPKKKVKDNVESFWWGETLKYAYLLFEDPTVLSLDDYILNTEAHPFKLDFGS